MDVAVSPAGLFYQGAMAEQPGDAVPLSGSASTPSLKQTDSEHLLVFYSDGAVVGEMNLLHAVRAEVSAPTWDPAQAILNRALGEGRYLDGIVLLTIMVWPEAGSKR